MSETLACHLQDYLRLRRQLGFKLHHDGVVLPQLVAYLDAAGARTVTADLAIAWARLPTGAQPIQWAHRLGVARGFATYLKTIDPATEVPPAGVFAARQQRPVPYLFSDADITALLGAARTLRPPLRAVTHETFFGLLAVSGMRVGEALGLARDDVDLTGGVLTIRDAKFGRERLIPLHPSVTKALRAYVVRRDQLSPTPRSTSFFVTSVGTALAYSGVRQTFVQLTTGVGLRTPTTRPRIHDFRHSFAVRVLLDWHRSGSGVEARMPVLSTYLGHVRPAGTYWYLSAAPELMELAAARLQARFGAPR